MAFKFSRIGKRRKILAAALVAAPLLGTVAWNLDKGKREFDLAMSCWVVVAFVVIFVALTELVGQTHPNRTRASYGYLEVLIGSDGYASTSKAVMWLWTLVFASALVLLSGMVWFSDLDVKAAFGEDWDAYLLLLGGPFASAVLAKGIVVAKSEDQAVNTTDAASANVMGAAPDTAQGGPTVADLAKSGSGDTSLPDTQYVVFSLVAIAYFVGAFIAALNDFAANREDAIHLPAIPPAMLGLTSLAALTYVGAKAVAKNGLRLVSVTPAQAAAGDDIKIMVVNAAPALTAGMINVYFRDEADKVADTRSPAADPERVGAVSSFDVVVPSLPAAPYKLVVTTPDGSTTPSAFTVDA